MTAAVDDRPATKALTPAQRKRLLAVVSKMSTDERERLLTVTKPRVVMPYFVHIPHPKQQVFLGLKGREAMFGGAAGGGKALATDTPLLTSRGWTTMGEVQVGDRLYDEQGRETTVIALSGVMDDRPCYRVTFSDGTSIVADGEHLWAVETPRIRSKRAKTGPWQANTITTAQMASSAWEGAKTPRARYSIPVAEPVKYPHADLSVDPYIFGYWLGDGDTRRGYITVGGQDIEQTRENFAERGYELTPLTGLYRYRVEGLSDALRADGAITTYRAATAKRIPEKYKRASISQRLELIQGLVDSDGYVDGDIEISLMNRDLVLDIQEVLTSLGIKSVLNEGDAILNGVSVGTKYRLKFMTHRIMSQLPRKVKRQKRSGFRGTHNRRYVTGVERIESVPVQCVQVDGPTHLYLAGKALVPTHNSDSLLMSALQYVDVPGYSALILRRTWPDLNAPGAILDRANTWFSGTPAHKRDGGRVWEFPTVDASGNPANPARISFGYMLHDKDRFKFQSAEYQFVGFDELTHFGESQYTYMFSRIRRPQLSCLNCGTAVRRYDSGWKHVNHRSSAAQKCIQVFPDQAVLNQYPAARDGLSIFDVPLRMRSATNPGGVGHEWVKSRFIDPKTREDSAIFVPSFLSDNPSLDQESYMENLQHLSPVDRQRLLDGDWDVTETGDMFERHWFKVLQEVPVTRKVVRFWDMASTDGGGDWTVGAKVRLSEDGRWVIEDLVRGQWSSGQKEQIIAQTAAADGPYVPVRMEQEPGSSGKDVIDTYRRRVLVGYNFDGVRATGEKTTRASQWSSAAEAGNVYIVAAAWNKLFLDEAAQFPAGSHDDQIDAVSGAVSFLSHGQTARLIV